MHCGEIVFFLSVSLPSLLLAFSCVMTVSDLIVLFRGFGFSGYWESRAILSVSSNKEDKPFISLFLDRSEVLGRAAND